MNPINLYYEVESAFVQMDHALENAQKHATPEGKRLYEHLMDELIGIKDHYRQELLALHTKKTAPAAGTTETAKSDSDKESTFSLDEKSEDVKGSCLILNVIDDEKVEAELSIRGTADHLLRLYAAATEVIVSSAPDLDLDSEDLEKAHQQGLDDGIDRLTQKAIQMIAEASNSKRDRLLRAVKAMNVPEDLSQKLFGGAEK